MNAMVVLKSRDWGSTSDVRPFTDACARAPQLRSADEICRSACLPDWPSFSHLRPQSRKLVEQAARRVLTALQDLLEPLEGEHVDGDARQDFHQAHACAASALANYIDPFTCFDIQEQAAGDRKPVLVCYGERWRQIETWVAGIEWVKVDGGDGCGLVYRGLLGKANRRGERRFVSYCPVCNQRRTALARAHVARIRQVYDHGFVEYPTFDASGNQVGEIWVGRCRCGRTVETTDITEHRCDRCQRRHR